MIPKPYHKGPQFSFQYCNMHNLQEFRRPAAVTILSRHSTRRQHFRGHPVGVSIQAPAGSRSVQAPLSPSENVAPPRRRTQPAHGASSAGVKRKRVRACLTLVLRAVSCPGRRGARTTCSSRAHWAAHPDRALRRALFPCDLVREATDGVRFCCHSRRDNKTGQDFIPGPQGVPSSPPPKSPA